MKLLWVWEGWGHNQPQKLNKIISTEEIVGNENDKTLKMPWNLIIPRINQKYD